METVNPECVVLNSRGERADPAGRRSAVVSLAAGAIWSGGGGVNVVCLAGQVWVTQAGDPRDTILHPADSFGATAGGKIVVQALKRSTVRFERWRPGKERETNAASGI
ncbi:MAG: DUF2917 domain-containing protein [Tepidisphaeraceae bacterium]